MYRKEYNRKVNNTMLWCWSLIVCSYIIGYGLEVLKGHRSFTYFMEILAVCLLPLIAAIIINIYYKGQNMYVRYIGAGGTMLAYTFLMMTATSKGVFVYLIPMIYMLSGYADNRLLGSVFSYGIVLNVIYVLLLYNGGYNTDRDVIFYEIQIGSLILSAFFLWKNIDLIRVGNEHLFKLSEDINRDDLTVALNRYFFTNNIKNIYSTANETTGLSMAFLDIDNFRKFNTDYGHECGDEVLKALAARISKVISQYDEMYLVRMGGDEFLILNSTFPFDRFKEIAVHVKEEVDGFSLVYAGQQVRVCISMGVTNSKVEGCDDYMELYRMSDRYLYKAKENGKNQIIFTR